jgi:hypothetical protein
LTLISDFIRLTALSSNDYKQSDEKSCVMSKPKSFFASLLRLLREDGFQSELLRQWQTRLNSLCHSNGMIGLLLVLGIARAVFLLQAYAPAQGADAMDYYTYAAYINGADLPAQAANVSPLYPIFVYINTYILGNFKLIFVWQGLMSASLGVLYYIGLRRFHTILAVLVAFIVLGDTQTGTIFNFTSTEPLYVFLLACIYALTLMQHEQRLPFTIWNIALGSLLVLVRETRTVARYLFIPIWGLVIVASRDWRRAGLILLSYLLTSALFALTTDVSNVTQQSSYNDTMLLRPLVSYDLLDANSGPASAELSVLINTCRNSENAIPLFPCLQASYGSEENTLAQLNLAYAESVTQRPFALYQRLFENFTDFLSLSGRQLYGTPTPADVQCADIPARVQRQTDYMFTREWAAVGLTDSQMAAYTAAVEEYAHLLCPPAPTNPLAHAITDYLSLRYRSLSRTNPYHWYISLFVLIIIIPWARKLWFPALLACGILFYHAAISAVLFNIQPRYVLVTNPFRGILLLMVLVIIGSLVLKLADKVIYQFQHRKLA